MENVEATDVLMFFRDPAELLVELSRVSAGELRDGVDAKAFEIAEHRGADGSQILQTALRDCHEDSP
jgi:hypothetical protein